MAILNEVTRIQEENSVAMITSLIASVVLFNRNNGVKEEDLIKNVQWLASEIDAKDNFMSFKVTPSRKTIKDSMKHLNKLVSQTRKAIEISLRSKQSQLNILMLGYYRNGLV